MDFIYKKAVLPNDYELLKNIDAAASTLHGKLNQLKTISLCISDYNKRYVLDHLNTIRNTLSIYAYILSWSAAYAYIPIDQFVFIDYGGGSGILSCLAKEAGIGTVIYSDIYDISCRDAKVIGQTIGTEADYYVHGDIDQLTTFLEAHSIQCNAIASFDVIEHVYDIETFLVKVSDLSNGPFNVVMASGANPLNPRIRKRLTRLHMKAEYTDRPRMWGHKERDCLRAYLDVRKEIVSQHAPSLPTAKIDLLARATRGLIQPEIEACVDDYLTTGKISRQPDHPTNTCDPYTGNWAEHLMNINHLRRVLLNNCFKVDILPGYYGNSYSPLKRVAARLLNYLITYLKAKGLMLSPFYTIYGRKHC